MAFKVIEIDGGVLVPGTLFLEPAEQEGKAGFAVIAGVFDTDKFPGKRINMHITWVPYLWLAEFTRDLFDSCGTAKPDIREYLPPGVTISNVHIRKRYGHLSSIQS